MMLLYRNKDKETILSQLKQDEISLITKLERKSAVEKYGKLGKYGAILITTKR